MQLEVWLLVTFYNGALFIKKEYWKSDDVKDRVFSGCVGDVSFELWLAQ